MGPRLASRGLPVAPGELAAAAAALQWVPGSRAVVYTVRRIKIVGDAPLQWVHGSRAVVYFNAGQHPASEDGASMGPRLASRGLRAGTVTFKPAYTLLQWVHGSRAVVYSAR